MKKLSAFFVLSSVATACGASQTSSDLEAQRRNEKRFECVGKNIEMKGSIQPTQVLRNVTAEDKAGMLKTSNWTTAKAIGEKIDANAGHIVGLAEDYLRFEITAPIELQINANSHVFTMIYLPKDMYSLRRGKSFKAVVEHYDEHQNPDPRNIKCTMLD